MNLKEKFSKNDGTNKVDEGQYISLIGCLMYLTATRSNIAFAVSLLSRFMHCASELHLQAKKKMVWYKILSSSEFYASCMATLIVTGQDLWTT